LLSSFAKALIHLAVAAMGFILIAGCSAPKVAQVVPASTAAGTPIGEPAEPAPTTTVAPAAVPTATSVPSPTAAPPTATTEPTLAPTTPPTDAATATLAPADPPVVQDPSSVNVERAAVVIGEFLNVRAAPATTGAVLGQTAEHHTSAEFVAFLASLVAGYGPEQEIHVILDNLSTHKTKRVNEFLADHPKVHFHFTPTYSSWLNQVELWFSKIERDLIHRGIFTSTEDLSRQLMNYITQHNHDPRPIKWKYTDVTRRVVTKHSSGTGN